MYNLFVLKNIKTIHRQHFGLYFLLKMATFFLHSVHVGCFACAVSNELLVLSFMFKMSWHLYKMSARCCELHLDVQAVLTNE